MDFGRFVLDDIADVEAEIRGIIPQAPREVYGMLEEYVFRGGKRIRPALLMLSFRALGGKDRKAALKAAALIELFHNFTLMHDDIEDDSRFRRGKPTLHMSHGLPVALNSGDALYTVVWNWMLALDMPPEKRIKLASILGCAFQKVVEGQGVELGWHRNGKIDVGEENYFEMAGGKTGALMGASSAAGAYIAGADAQTVERFRMFGEALGLAFQIQDDILNVAGDFSKYKKEIGGDITEGKRTLMVIHALAHATAKESRELASIISSHTRDAKKIARAIELMRKYDSLSYAQLKAREFVEATSAFLSALPQSRERGELERLAQHVITREF